MATENIQELPFIWSENLTIDADLTAASMASAFDQIHEIVRGNSFEYPCYYLLKIASQNIGEAIALKVAYDFVLDISPVYEPDEWSLTGIKYNKESGAFDEICVTTKGA
jgi:hypothetical protein